MNLDEDKGMMKELEQRERRTRGITSRRMDIPPTPRDTLAVLRQAAEVERDRPVISWLPAGVTRAVMSVAVALLVFAGIWWLSGPAPQSGTPLAEETAVFIADPGLDLADWDLEFEAVWEEIDQTLTALETEDAWETL